MVTCEFCGGVYQGYHGLSIHQKKSGTCADAKMKLLFDSIDIEVQPLERRQQATASREYNAASVGEEELHDTLPCYPFEDDEGTIENLSVGLPLSPRRSTPALESSGEQMRGIISLKLAHAILLCQSGMGLSKEDTNRLLSVVVAEDYDPREIAFNTYDMLEKYVNDFRIRVFGEDSVKTVAIDTGNENNQTILTYKDAGEALNLLVHENYDDPDFAKESVVLKNDKNERVFKGPETGLWWEKIQAQLRRDAGEDTAEVLALILYSDSTALTQNLTVSAWPIYMTLGNIPLHKRKRPGAFQLLGLLPDPTDLVGLEAEDKQKLFTEAMDIVLKPLKDKSFTGITYRHRKLYPLLYSYVTDYPEGSKVTATYGAWNCEYPCSTCLVHKDSLNKSLHSFQYRTEQIMRKKVVEIENGLTTDKAESAYPVPCPLWGIRYSQSEVGNVYKAVLVESLHQADQGIFKTMFKDTQKYAARSLALLDKRMENLFSVGFIPNFRKIPNKVWVSGSSLQANEYRTLMQVVPLVLSGIVDDKIIKAFVNFWEWYHLAVRSKAHTEKTLTKVESRATKLISSLIDHMKGTDPEKPKVWAHPKTHAISHYPSDIRRSGATNQYSSEMFENLHQKVAKAPYRTSNKRPREVAIFMFKIHERQLLIELITEVVESSISASNDTYWTKADDQGCNVLCSTGQPVNTYSIMSSTNEEDKRLYKALKEYMMVMHGEEKGAPLKLFFHNSCAIGRSADIEGSSETWIAYATESHHEKSKFTCVAVRGADRHGRFEVWYARIHKFVSFTEYVEGNKIGRSTAFVKYFKVLKSEGKDKPTGCIKLCWESKELQFSLIDIDNILRIVHIVPSYRGVRLEEDKFLLNRFLFR